MPGLDTAGGEAMAPEEERAAADGGGEAAGRGLAGPTAGTSTMNDTAVAETQAKEAAVAQARQPRQRSRISSGPCLLSRSGVTRGRARAAGLKATWLASH